MPNTVKKHEGLSEGTYKAVLEALEHSPADLKSLLEPLHQADIADLLERLPQDKREMVADFIPTEDLGPVIAELDEGAQEHILGTLDSEEVREAVSTLESDDVADLVQHMGEEQAQIAKGAIDKEKQRLLNYDPETAGGLMQLEVLTARPHQTVGDVLKIIRTQREALPKNPGTVFVVDQRSKLLGTIAVTRLVKYPLNEKLSKIMRQDPITVTPDVDQKEVARIFERYDIHNLAVVNKKGQLLGRITIDDVLDTVLEEAERQQLRAAGIDENEDLFAPAIPTTFKRLPWLIVNLFTAILASLVITQFEGEIQQLVALAVLMPIVASMGGNAGTQTLTVTVRGLATGQITFQNAMMLLWKEIRVGGFAGFVLALILALGTYLFYENLSLALVILIATIVNHLLAAVAGHFVPLMLKKFGYDPAISSGVLVTTVTDVGGFFVFLGLAAVMLF